MLTHFVVRMGNAAEVKKERSYYSEQDVERGASHLAGLAKSAKRVIDLPIGVFELSSGYPASVGPAAQMTLDGFSMMWPEHLFKVAPLGGPPAILTIVIQTMNNLWTNPRFLQLIKPLEGAAHTVKTGAFVGWERKLFEAFTEVVRTSGGGDSEQSATLSKIIYARPAIVTSVLPGTSEETVNALSPLALGVGAAVLKKWRDEDAVDPRPNAAARPAPAPPQGVWAQIKKWFSE